MSEHIEVSTVICHIWSDNSMFMYSNIKIIMLTIHTRKLLIIDYRGLQFRLDVTRIRGFSPGIVHLERATQTCYLFSAPQRNLRRAVCLSPPLLNSFVKTRYVSTELYAMFKRKCNPRQRWIVLVRRAAQPRR